MSTGPPIETDAALATQDACDVSAALSGDGEAYRRLVERYQQAIAQQMSRFSRELVTRDELVHDVFVEAYISLRSYRGSAPWLHWLRKIAVRVGYRYWTSRKVREREIAVSDDDWRRFRGSQPNVEDAVSAAELTFALLAQLPSGDRLILTLLYWDGCTIAEAAARAGWSVVGTKVRAYRARNRLRKLLERGVS